MVLTISGAIIQDGLRQEAQRISEQAADLASRLTSLGISRLVLPTTRADMITIALSACELANCELLLCRQTDSTASRLWEEWGADALCSDDLSLKPLPDGHSSETNFALLLTTSGTTGPPKVTRHSLATLLKRIPTPNSDEKRKAIWLLTYHPATFAGVQVLLTSLVGGGTLVATSNLSVAELAALAIEVEPTHISGTPTFWRAFVSCLGDDAKRLTLKHVTLGGEIVDQRTLDCLRETFPTAAITHIYASTEAGVLFGVKDACAGFPERWLHETIDGVMLRIRNNILEVTSPRSMEGYATLSHTPLLTSDGWLITNDRVKVRGDRVFFLGRADSSINVGGAKVSAEEVETILLEVPGVIDARVFAKPNPITGSVVAAEIHLEKNNDETKVRKALVAHARETLEPFKVPRIMKFTSRITISESGKKCRKNE